MQSLITIQDITETRKNRQDKKQECRIRTKHEIGYSENQWHGHVKTWHAKPGKKEFMLTLTFPPPSLEGLPSSMKRICLAFSQVICFVCWLIYRIIHESQTKIVWICPPHASMYNCVELYLFHNYNWWSCGWLHTVLMSSWLIRHRAHTVITDQVMDCQIGLHTTYRPYVCTLWSVC